MGFFDDDIIEEVMAEFTPVELNEGNVQAIFNRCGKLCENGTPSWDEEVLKNNKAKIRYLLGQMKLVHIGMMIHKLDVVFLERYDGKTWTDDIACVINLLNMGGELGFCSFPQLDSEQFVNLDREQLEPTGSPKDPDFPVWWERYKESWTSEGRYEKNGASALYWYEKAAEKGNAEAQACCGLMYYNGEGAVVDKTKALYWLKKAAEQGNVHAQVFCGKQYDTGEGTVADKTKALYWFEKAAKQGNTNAQFLCAMMYYNGEGTAVDKTKALYWYEKAAEQGDVHAQARCGSMYYQGEGTAVDKTKGLYWLEKAAKQEDN